MKKTILIIVILVAFGAPTNAQEKAEPYRKWEIGINGGGATFIGEYGFSKGSLFNHFNQWNSHLDTDYGWFFRKNFSQVFALELGWNHSNITGSWKYNTRPIGEFRTQVIQSDLNSVWNLSNLFSKNKYDRKISWYGKIGAGVSHLWRREGVYRLFYNDQWKFTIPIGAGVTFALTNHFKLNAGTSWSWINTDRLDGMKTEALTTKTGNYETQVFGTKLYTYLGFSYAFGKNRKPAPMVESPKSEPQPEPKLKPEPKKEIQTAEMKHIKPAVIGKGYNVYFGFDKWNIDGVATSDLDRLAKDMNENPSVDVEIKSHTDSRGPASYNMKLAEKRGKSVIDYLAAKGVEPSRVNAQAFGETQPVNKCKDGIPCTKAEYAVNRRTETLVIK